MLTVEILKQNGALAALTDEQLNAIAEMSRNDEASVIGTKIGALHGQYDQDIFSITGITKKSGEKSYDYAKRVLNDFKAKTESVETIKGQLTEANNRIAKLQQDLEKNSGDDTLKQQLKDTKNQVTQLQAQLQTKEAEFTKQKEALENTLKSTHVDYAFEAVTAGLNFKAGITEPVQKTLLSAAKSEVFAKGTPDFIEDNGQRILVLRDTNGNILNNPSNNLNPYTIKELLLETSIKDVLDLGTKQTGGGTKGFGGSGKTGTSLDLSGAKNQIEAGRIIEGYLLSQGLTRDSAEFDEQFIQLRTDNNVTKLPIR